MDPNIFLICATFKLADSTLNLHVFFLWRDKIQQSQSSCQSFHITDDSVISTIILRGTALCNQWTKTCPAAFDNQWWCWILESGCFDNEVDNLLLLELLFWILQITCIVCQLYQSKSCFFTWEQSDHNRHPFLCVKVNSLKPWFCAWIYYQELP